MQTNDRLKSIFLQDHCGFWGKYNMHTGEYPLVTLTIFSVNMESLYVILHLL